MTSLFETNFNDTEAVIKELKMLEAENVYVRVISRSEYVYFNGCFI